MSANGSQEKLAILMQVATSRLDIVNDAVDLVQKTQKQADRVRELKKKAMTLPVIGSIAGTLGGIFIVRLCAGKKSRPLPPPQLQPSGGWVNSPLFRLVIELLIPFVFPSIKKVGFNLISKKISSLFK